MNAETITKLISYPLEIICLDEIDSTNLYAARLIKSGQITCDTLITAKRQTAGRGRQGRTFFSPEGGMYMSLIIRPPLSIEDSLLLTPAAAVAVYRAIKKICRVNCGIKWVNDIELNGKKLCGILTENPSGAIITGIGLNFVSQSPIPPELAEIVTCLYQGEPPVSVEELAAVIINEYFNIIKALPATDFLDDYRSQSTLLGRQITVHAPGGSYIAVAREIDAFGRLIVTTSSGERITLNSGEVSVRNNG